MLIHDNLWLKASIDEDNRDIDDAPVHHLLSIPWADAAIRAAASEGECSYSSYGTGLRSWFKEQLSE